MNFLESDFAAYLSLAVPAGAGSHQQSERWCEEVNVMNSVVSDPDLVLVVSNLGNRKSEGERGEERLILVQVSHFLSRALEFSLMVT